MVPVTYNNHSVLRCVKFRERTVFRAIYDWLVFRSGNWLISVARVLLRKTSRCSCVELDSSNLRR